MAEQFNGESLADTQPRRGRGPTKSYPVVPFTEVLQLARGIFEHGVGDEIERLTLLDKLGISPSSSKTRNLITSSAKYGLTIGSYGAPTLKLTEDSLLLLRTDTPAKVAKQKEFDLAIARFEEFLAVYERIKESRLRDEAVLRGEMGRAGVPEFDRASAVEAFTSNLRDLGLIENIAGSDQVRAIEVLINRIPEHEHKESPATNALLSPTTPSTPSPEATRQVTNNLSEPSVHIDVQIHIDSNASPEQIDQIFASMARHLYGREGS